MTDLSHSERLQALAGIARPVFGLTQILAYGQSYAIGWDGWPALTTTPRHDSLMLGPSVRPGPDAALRPLVATVQDAATGEVLAPAEAVARAAGGAVLVGETVLEGALGLFRERMLAHLGPAARSVVLLGGACGAGGRSIEALSKGGEAGQWERLAGAVALGRRAAEAAGRSHGIGAILFLQGEANMNRDEEAAYFDRLVAMRRDLLADLAPGQAPPALFLYQTSGEYMSQTQGVALAQLRAARELPGVYLAAPAYPVTCKPGHLDANGYRWLGQVFGKVMHRVLTLGEDWPPFAPCAAWREGAGIRLRFAVPVPPLAWGQPYAGHAALDFADKGFSVADADGPIAILGADLAGADQVRLRLARRAGAGAVVHYADAAHRGRGCLCDSDRTRASEVYEYDAARGHAPAANISALVGRPYPLANWCAAFRISVSAQ